VWSWDFVHDMTADGQTFRCLTVKDEHMRWCLVVEVACSFTHERVIEVLTRLIARYGCPQYMRSDNGPEFVAGALLKFFEGQGIQPSRMPPGQPWQNGSNESFNGTFRRECLDAEWFHRLTEACVVIEDWRQPYEMTSGLIVRWAIRRLDGLWGRCQAKERRWGICTRCRGTFILKTAVAVMKHRSCFDRLSTNGR
jgi:hypothetical protein